MNINKIIPARQFFVGEKKDIAISHSADIELEANEQITFVGPEGSEVDFVKKEWGYYLTPSVNRRLKSFGMDTYLVQNSVGAVYVMSVEKGKTEAFNNYIASTEQKIILNMSDIYCAS